MGAPLQRVAVARASSPHLRVGNKLDQIRSCKALILLPPRHHCAIIDTEDIHLVDPSILKLTFDLGFLEARDLAGKRAGGMREAVGGRQLATCAIWGTSGPK